MTDRPPIVVEICVDDLEGALLAEQAGAHRVELCAALSEGGVTPSLGLVQTVLDRVSRIDVQVMIRPRGGHFMVDPPELAVMLADIAAFRALACPAGVALGFVFGALTPDLAIDKAATARLRDACARAPVTFHKAFDHVADRTRALDDLAELKVDRVLTSGAAASAEAGCAELGDMVRQGAARGVGILAGGGLRAHNVRAVIDRTGVGEVHLRAPRERSGRPPSTSREEIAAVLRAVRSLS